MSDRFVLDLSDSELLTIREGLQFMGRYANQTTDITRLIEVLRKARPGMVLNTTTGVSESVQTASPAASKPDYWY